MGELLRVDGRGLWCEAGGFHIDPWGRVPLAVVTHAHGDHARPGMGAYVCAAPGAGLLRRRVGSDAPAEIRAVPYGERVRMGGVTLSLHPAGHVLGSAQVRVERGDEVWVVSGDYKREADPTCAPFEVVACDVFVTEATFGLPIYRWRPAREVASEIWAWWEENRAAGRASVLFCYALGKAQRVLAELSAFTDRAVWVHGAVEPLTEAYREAGVSMLPTRLVGERVRGESFAGELVIAPPSAAGSPWMRRFGAPRQYDTGFASGWMRVRGIRRRRGYDRGFVISDHADWDGLVRTVRETGARRVLATHGYTEVLAKHLRGEGVEAGGLPTGYAAEEEDEGGVAEGERGRGKGG